MKTLTGDGVDERYVHTADDERLYTEDSTTGERLWTLRGLDGLVLTEYRQDDDGWLWERDYIHRAGQLFASQGRGEGCTASPGTRLPSAPYCGAKGVLHDQEKASQIYP